MTGFRYITFDCYGTLIDWKRGIGRALAGVLPGPSPREGELISAYIDAEKKVEKEYMRYRDVLRLASVDAAERLGVKLSWDRASVFADSLPTWPAFRDTAASLRELRKMGYSLYILSNVDTDQLQKTIKNNQFEVDGFVTAEMTKTYKPAPGHWRSFMEETGARPDEILHAAQSVYHDIIPAGRLGIPTAWVNRYGDPDDGVRSTYVVSNLSELTKAVPKS